MRVHLRKSPRHAQLIMAAILTPIVFGLIRNTMFTSPDRWPVVAYAQLLMVLVYIFVVFLEFERTTAKADR